MTTTVRAPLIVLCAGRSFSSVVSCMLGQHPQIFAAPELNLFLADTLGELRAQLTRRRRLYSLHGLVRSLALLQYGDQSEAAAAAAWRWIEARDDWTIERVFAYLREAVAPRLLLDKSPSTAEKQDNLARLLRAAPDMRVLHLTRHPLAVGKSIYRVKSAKAALGRTGALVDPYLVEDHWVKVQHYILGLTDTLPMERQMRLRGELLLEHPRAVLAQLCDWLGIDASADAIEAMLHPEQNPFARLGPDNARYGNNVDFLKRPAFRQGSAPAASLDMPLPWLMEQRHFADATCRIARRLGYR